MTNTLKNLRENIAAGQLARLKKEYEPLRKIDMSKHKGQVEKTTAMLRKLKIGTLIDLHKENIPWISDIAKSLVLKDKRFAHQVESVEEGGPPADGGPGSGAHNHKGSNKVFNKDRGIFKALLNLSKKKEYKKVSKAFVNLTMPSPMAKDKEIAKSLNKRLKQLAPKLGKKEKAKLLRIADLASTYESIEEGVNIKALAKQFRKNEDENRHSENYLMLAKAFGTSREVREVEAIIRRNKIQGHTDHKDIKWMFDNIGKYFHKLKESVEESLIVGFNKSSKEYKAGYAAAKKGIKYDDNPHDAGVHGMNWQSGHNAFKADQLRKAGKPNYGARGQFEEVQLDEAGKLLVKDFRMVIKIAIKHTNDMESAIRDIEKYKKGLSNHPDVMDILKKANEEVQLDEVVGPFQQVSKLLIKYGNNPKEVKRMMTKHMPYVTKKYPNASPAKVAEIISSLSATEELEEGTWHIAKNMSKLKKTMKRPMPKSSFYYNFVVKHIGDDELWDDLGALKSGQDMVPAIMHAMKRLGIKEEVEIDEADLTKTQIKKVHDKADELPKHDFIKRYGKDGDAVRYATATNIVKKKLGIEEERSPEVAGVLKKYIIGHPLRWSSKEGKKNKRDFIKLQNLALTDMGKFRKKFDDMEADKGDDNYNQQAVRDVLAKAGLSKHLPK